jgi:hypothetical protein
VAADNSEDREIVVAVRRFDLGLAAQSPVLGFDLDGVCTCGGDGGTIGESCATTDRHCDDEQGRDNVTQLLFRHLRDLDVDIEGSLNANVEQGISTIVLHVQHYNGLENDPDVLVSVFGSSGIRQALGDGGRSFTAPTFKGDDKWSVNTSQLAPPFDRYVSSQARGGYVAGRTLVAHASASIPIREGVSVDLNDAVVVAKLDASGTTVTEGTIAGRWPIESALHVCGEFPIPGGDHEICDDPLFDKLVRPNICAAADLAATPGAPQSARCDALSIAIAFTTVPSLLGPLISDPLSPAHCQDPSLFRCAP